MLVIYLFIFNIIIIINEKLNIFYFLHNNYRAESKHIPNNQQSKEVVEM